MIIKKINISSQFKPIFLGQRERSVPCATTSQKCVRTNDIENVGVTARHHTFFEMLGNFSFGDYFKAQAIQYAWELSTVEFGIPADRIWVSVYEEDDEALALWRDKVGVPAERIKRMGAKDNFWASGPTGPCGPCSELYFDFHPERGTDASVSLEDDSRFIEFYNLVFMELNRAADGALTPLKSKNIDTGMGLERVAQILQQVPNNYETDLILPIIQKAAGLAGLDYFAADERTKTSLKVIGDHTRAVTYLISDGVNPSNVGRGYVVRRLLRRVIMKGRLLGITRVFTPEVAATAIELSGGCDPQVARNQQRIFDELRREEERFVATLERGQKILDELLVAAAAGSKTLQGDDAFLLYDTYGFPLEITQEIAAEKGVAVDLEGFERAMEAQRVRAKSAREAVDLTADAILNELRTDVGTTSFLGYSDLTASARVVALLQEGRAVDQAAAGARVDIVLDRTPFYAESGGQIGDQGVLAASTSGSNGNGSAAAATVVLVNNVTKAAGGDLFVHKAEVQSGVLRVDDTVSADVDAALRRRAQANHTATHLLQSALKQVLGADTAQQGSLVEFDRLRFDFNAPKALTPEQLAEIERTVNVWIEEAHPTQVAEMSLTDAKGKGATAMFGEKYGDVVRVVDVPGVSMELCGGTHVANTAEIGGFKILSESGIAAGVRRIEAVTGPALVAYLQSVDGVVRSLTGRLKVKSEELPDRIAAMQEELKAASKEIADLRGKMALAKAESLLGAAVDGPAGRRVLVARMDDGVDAASLQAAALKLQQKLGPQGAVLLASVSEPGKLSFVAAFGEEAVKGGLKAGQLVGEVAKICGGGGGGKPNLAQAGGKDPSKVDEALEVGRGKLMG